VAHDITALRTAALAEALRESGDDPALAEPAVEVFVAARQRVEPYPMSRTCWRAGAAATS